jgi:cytoskeletal protein RodZ
MSGRADGLGLDGDSTKGATEQAVSMPTIATIRKPTRNGRRVKKRGFCMGLILLEALLALFILIAIVWWTMFSGRSKGELRQTKTETEDAANKAQNGTATPLAVAAQTPEDQQR